MGVFIARQPNGLLCRFSTVVDCVTHYNMTDEAYIELRAEQARNDARWELEHQVKPFEWVKEMTLLPYIGEDGEMVETHITPEEWEKVLKEMGDEP